MLRRSQLATHPIIDTFGVVYLLCPGRAAAAGGIGRVVTNLERIIPALDPMLRVRVVDTRGSGSIAFSPIFFVIALASIVRAAAYRRITLLHVNLASYGSSMRKIIVVALARALRIPILIHLHGAVFDVFYRSLPAPMRATIRWMFMQADRVVVLGENWRRFLIQEVGLAADKVAVIANGVPAPSAARPADAGEPPHILFLGRLEERKGVPELIEALASPAVATRSWVATLAGDGDREVYATRARALGLGDRINLPGWVDQAGVEALLASARMLVLPSHAEALPMAVIEALAHSVAVVTTPVGAIPEFLANGETAVIVPPGNPTALAEAINLLLNDPTYRERIARRGNELFHRHFEIHATARRMVKVYRDIVVQRTYDGGGTTNY